MDSRNKHASLSVRTPEGVIFSFQLASPFRRFLAWGVDICCLVMGQIIVSRLLSIVSAVGLEMGAAFGLIVSFALQIGYGVSLEWLWRGQTIGKRLLRLRVMDQQGLRLQFSQIVVRNLLRVVDILPIGYLVGAASCMLTRHSQRLGDIAANTVVIHSPVIVQPDLKQILADKFNSFLEHPHLAARLRRQVSPHEARIALQGLIRREGLEPQARVRLYSELAEHFRSLVAFPQEATHGLSDEQYVRNVVEVLLRRGPGKPSDI